MIEVSKNFLVPNVGINKRSYLATRNLLYLLVRLSVVNRVIERESTSSMFSGFVVRIAQENVDAAL